MTSTLPKRSPNTHLSPLLLTRSPSRQHRWPTVDLDGDNLTIDLTDLESTLHRVLDGLRNL